MIRIERILAPNPGVYTLEGTNTWVVGFDPSVVIDPGPMIDAHLDEVQSAAGRVAHVLVTHDHPDHAPGAAAFAARVGAPLAAARSAGAEPIRDRMVFRAGDVEVTAVLTPGHTPDHVAFWLPSERALFTGDAVLGRGTSVIDPPEGDVVRYLASLRTMLELGPRTIHPGHGPVVVDARAKLVEYLDHRAEREHEIVTHLEDGASTIEELVERIYTDHPREVYPLAARSVLAHLKKLEAEARVQRVGRGVDAPWSLSAPRSCARCGRPVRSRSRYCDACNLILLQEGASPGPPAVELIEVTGDRERWVPSLLEADEEEPLRTYLDEGELLEIRADGRTAGVVLLLREGDTVEIRNLALDEAHRRRGIGRAAIERVAERAAAAGADRLIVGTAETSAGAIEFYRACGFADAARRPGFFDSYPTPVIEDGVQAHDMVMFERVLGRRGVGARDPER